MNCVDQVSCRSLSKPPERDDVAADLADQAFTHLPRGCQQLLALLTGDQPLSYAQISAQLGVPARSIGPRHDCCLGKLRHDPAIAALLNPDTAPMETGLLPVQAPGANG